MLGVNSLSSRKHGDRPALSMAPHRIAAGRASVLASRILGDRFALSIAPHLIATGRASVLASRTQRRPEPGSHGGSPSWHSRNWARDLEAT